jgi:hypothetical protein
MPTAFHADLIAYPTPPALAKIQMFKNTQIDYGVRVST